MAIGDVTLPDGRVIPWSAYHRTMSASIKIRRMRKWWRASDDDVKRYVETLPLDERPFEEKP